MRPARIPHFPHTPIAWAVCGVFGILLVGCGSSDDNRPKGIIPGMALGKLCHELNRGGLPITLTLQLGDPVLASITARTGVCAPMKGMPCASIPVGLVPLRVMEGDKLLASRTVILWPGDGGVTNEYLFRPLVNNAGTAVEITGGQIRFDSCKGLDFAPPDAGVGDGGEGGATDGPTPDAGVVDAAADVAVSPDLAADVAAPDDVAAVDAPEDAPAPAADTTLDSVTD